VGVGLVERIVDKLPRSNSYLYRWLIYMHTGSYNCFKVQTASKYIKGAVAHSIK
jgi:hypothetical protein